MSDSDTHAVAERIKEYVLQHWAESRNALLLSKIGARLRQDEPHSVEIIGKSLRLFIDAIPEIAVIQHPNIRERVGAIPADVVGLHPPEELLAQSAPGTARPSLRRDFWEAFYRPINGRRFVLLHKNDVGGFSIDDFDAPPQTSEISVEILASDLISVSREINRTDAIWEKIRAWCQRNNLKIDLFVLKSHTPSSSFQSSKSSTLLLKAIENLSVEDQKRISIPLDILIKIIGT